MPITKAPFGRTSSGEAVSSFTLENRSGTEVGLTNYGARLVRLATRDRRGELGDVVLGFDSVGSYERCDAYLGASIGRYANRIAGGQFELDARRVTLARNEYPHHLHGGHVGFDRVIWDAEPRASHDGLAVQFSRRSPAMEEGYPGALDVSITYTLVDDDVLRIDYEAETDAPTVVNLTNHAYFNLGGVAQTPSVFGHELRIDAEWFLPIDTESIPMGDLALVARTPFDFRRGTRLGSRLSGLPQRAPRPRTEPRAHELPEPKSDPLASVHPQLLLAGGYDHTWVLAEVPKPTAAHAPTLPIAAELYEPVSGRVVTIATTQPGLQLYTGNRLHSMEPGREGIPYERYMGLCLETQHLPDSPNHSAYPSTVLRPGEVYRESTEYRLGVR